MQEFGRVIDKQESRRIRQEIQRVLLDVWDPIGIQNEPNAQDEYDSYLGGIFGLLVSGASDEDLTTQLWQIATDQMGLSPKRNDMASTVRALRKIQLPTKLDTK